MVGARTASADRLDCDVIVMRPYQKNNNMYTICRNNITNKSSVRVDI